MSLNSARNWRHAGFDLSLVSSFIPYWCKRVLASLSLKPTRSSVPRAVGIVSRRLAPKYDLHLIDRHGHDRRSPSGATVRHPIT